jgi:hypothetical protein
MTTPVSGRRSLIASTALATGLLRNLPAQADEEMKPEPLVHKERAQRDRIRPDTMAILADDQVVQQGNLPIQPDVKALRELSSGYTLLKGTLTDPGERAASAFRPSALGIDSDFHYSLQAAEEDFNYLHVETLLNQIADILDRCVQERAAWEDSATRAAVLALEMEEFFKTDEIHKDEIDKGIYTLAYRMGLPEIEAIRQQISELEISQHRLEATRRSEFEGNAFAERMDAAQVLAILPYAGNHTQFSWNGIMKKPGDHALSAAARQARADFEERDNSLSAQIADVEGQRAAARARLESATAKNKWDEADIQFKRRRTQVARSVAEMKVKLSCVRDGALNYAQRRDDSQIRFRRDFDDAISRYRPLARGLSAIYGYSMEDPGNDSVRVGQATPNEVEENPFLGRLDLFIYWLRSAMTWMIRFQGREQSYSRVISVRVHCGSDDGWAKGASGNGRWTVEVSEALFPHQCHVRLRSVSVFGVAARSQALWSCTLKLPGQALIRHLDGAAHTVDQTHLPTIFFGRVTSRDSIRPPEVGNASVVHNASPLGTWEVQLTANEADNSLPSAIDDLHLDLEVAVRSL